MEKLKKLLQRKRSEIEGEFSPYFYQYFKNSIFESNKGFEGYLETSKYFFEITKSKEKKVLDIGCGFGLNSIIFSLFGAKSIDAVDIDGGKIKILKQIIRKLDLNKCRAHRIDGRKIPFSDKTFDVVIAIEVISHAYDLDIFLSEVKRVLKSGGLFYIRDSNNALNVLGFRERKKIQMISEYKGSVSVGLPESYLALRRKMIQNKFPQISVEELNMLSSETKGLWGEKLYDAIEKYKKNGKLVNEHNQYFRNPITGEFQEKAYNPYSLKYKLKELGFRNISLFPSLPISPKRKTIYRVIAPIFPIIFLFLGSFNIIAKK